MYVYYEHELGQRVSLFGYLPHELNPSLINAAQSVCEWRKNKPKKKKKKQQIHVTVIFTRGNNNSSKKKKSLK